MRLEADHKETKRVLEMNERKLNAAQRKKHVTNLDVEKTKEKGNDLCEKVWVIQANAHALAYYPL